MQFSGRETALDVAFRTIKESIGGATVTRRCTALNGYVVEINDAQAPSLKALSGVRIVEANSIGCLVETNTENGPGN